ncbi:MAG: protein translocase subunit SecF [Candidatus Neomarinimicrobiota bacterium]|nr:MAG: protein translocase subunit SecF [Candidatus Neomarinimicrobiota bacterium]
MRFFKKTNIPFVKFSKAAVTGSMILIAISIISVFLLRGLNYGIDFTGGSLSQVKFDNPTTTGQIRKGLSSVNLQNSVIQKTSGVNEFLIRSPQIEGVEDIPGEIRKGLEKLENPFEVRRTELVGPKIGEELRGSAIWAIIWAIVVIGIYITVRFKFQFAIGAVVALIHDVLITLGIFSLLQLEISLSTIAAFLTIVGYSLNDTIVLYDRVRENMKKRHLEKIGNIINISINEVLSRTIITSLTTFIVVLVLAFAPGEVRIFAIAMIIGVIVGTYSSINIAGPVVIYWQQRTHAKNK